jgi:hypothetical protein
MSYCSLGHHGCPEEARDLGVTVDELHWRNRQAFDEWEPIPVHADPYEPQGTSYADALWGSPPTGSFARSARLPGPRNARYVTGVGRNVAFR